MEPRTGDGGARSLSATFLSYFFTSVSSLGISPPSLADANANRELHDVQTAYGLAEGQEVECAYLMEYRHGAHDN